MHFEVVIMHGFFILKVCQKDSASKIVRLFPSNLGFK